jgi:hypothetical protein
MVYTIRLESDYVRADLFNRETAEETQEFFDQVAGIALRKGRRNILIWVHSSSPVFTVERSGFFQQMRGLSAERGHKIGLLADTPELGYSHEYLESLGSMHGMNVRRFKDQPSAIAWFRAEH